MSHSKLTKRNHSLYIEKWNPSTKKYINTCVICGRKGYSPIIEQEEFRLTPSTRAGYRELTKTLNKMQLDESGRCEECARVQDGHMERKRHDF